ncbi:MAG TPA: SpoIIIAH-like family protein [Candidatus Onthousia faecigallinarum]|nr:SpoIIIAH-like family protein [Candidatus Onthousia faecigallinarum]
MIKKQNLWFLTLFSLILVLSVYYITMPNDLLVAQKAADNTDVEEQKENSGEEEVTIQESNNLTALRVSLEEERDATKTKLQATMTDENATIEEKNNAYEQLKYLSEVEGMEEKLEKIVKDNYKLDSFIKVDNNQIKVVAVAKNHDTALANNIMRTIQKEFDQKQTITVKFET